MIMESRSSHKIPPSRRSATNLSHLTLAPLTSKVVDEDDDYSTPPRTSLDEPYDSGMASPTLYTTTSYIQGKSAPTTPGILSRNSSAAQLSHTASKSPGGGLGSKSYPHLAFADNTFKDDEPIHHHGAYLSAKVPLHGGSQHLAPLAKSKSTTVLSPAEAGQRRRKKQRGRGGGLTAGDSGEWLFRAGTAISTEARESKGQSWLVSRESSTSLAPRPPPSAEDEASTAAAAVSPEASRVQSRAGSARTSRRPSRTGGSRPDLPALGMTSAGSALSLGGGRLKTPLTRQISPEDYFGKSAAVRNPATLVGPDFVDRSEMEREEGDDDDDDLEGDEGDEVERRLEEEEVAKLAREQSRGYGLGGFVDKVVSWTLFDMKEEHEGNASAKESEDETEDDRKRALRKEDSRITTGPQLSRDASQKPEQDEAGGWKDAAWFFSVASKVLL